MYEKYVTEVIRVTCENTANMAKGSYLKARYADIVDPKPEQEETRTGEEVIEHMKKRLRGG